MPARHGLRRVLRWARNLVLGLVGLVVVVVLGAYVVFSTSWGRERLREQIASQLQAKLIGGGSLGGVEGNPLSELVLTDLVINGPDRQPAISIERLTIELPLMPLISQQLRVDRLIAEGLDVHVKRLADGRINVASLTEPGEPSTWSIHLPDVRVHRGHVRVELGGEPVDIDDLELALDAAMPFGGPTSATAALDARWRQRGLPVSLRGTVYSDDEVTQSRWLLARLGDIELTALGVSVPKSSFSLPVTGSMLVRAPATSIAQLAPGVELPGDVALYVAATPDGRLTHLDASGTVGPSALSVLVEADLQARLARGMLMAHGLELERLTRGQLRGDGGVFATFDVDGNDTGELPTVSAIATAWATTERQGPVTAVIAIESQGERLQTAISASSGAGLRANLDAAIRKRGEVLTLERAAVLASTRDVRRASHGVAPVRGALSANLRASGALAPEPDLAIEGRVDGRRIRVAQLGADTLRLRIDARHLPSRPVGTARLEASGLVSGDLELGTLTVSAGNRPDGRLQVTVRSQPKRAPWLIDLDALVTTGETILVDLQRHRVRAAGGALWRGSGGRLAIAPQEVSLRGFASTSADGHVRASGRFVRAGRRAGDLEASVDTRLALANLEKAYRGSIAAEVDVTRTRGRFAGTVHAQATGIALDPRSPITLDADVSIEARADQLRANVDLTTAAAGRAHLALDVDAPKDIADARAWRTLGRKAIRTASLELEQLDLGRLGQLAGLRSDDVKGRLDGELAVTPDTVVGGIRVTGVEVKQLRDLGRLEADLKVAPAPRDDLTATLSARLVPAPGAVVASDVTQRGAARLVVEAKFRAPERLFDPVAWQRLGTGAFRGGSLRADRLAFQPGTLERLGIVSDLRGELAVGAELAPGLDEARFAVNVYQLRGGMFARPVALSVSGVLDEDASRVVGNVVADGVTLVRLSSRVPVGLTELRRDPQGARTARLDATATIDHVPAATLMRVLGTSQITGGVLNGTVRVGGTVAKPTVVARLLARGVTVPVEAGEPMQQLDQLSLLARWDGARGSLAVDGNQSAGGLLMIRALGSPTDPDSVRASFYANKVDIAPLVAFMPGPAGGLGGRMNASFQLRGANPRTAELEGSLRITQGRIPLAPAVGTLFKGEVRLDVKNRIVDLDVRGSLGRGALRLAATAPLEGATPRSGALTLRVDNVQLIGTTQPVLTGVITADVSRVDETWRANLRVDRMTVRIPEEKGTKLSPVGVPDDIVYGGEKIHHGEKQGRDAPVGLVRSSGEGVIELDRPTQVEGPIPRRAPPDVPVVDARVTVRNVFVESKEVRGLVGGNLRAIVGENQEVAVLGQVTLTRGVLDLFNRRYQVDKANLHFDGSPDPVLDVRITHDFPEVTTITEVRGRMSDPQLSLTSDPGTYSQAELLGFLLGGEPGGDPENAPSATERVAGAGASFLSNKVSGYVKRALPVDIDVLRYEAASSTSSAAVTVGTWITDTLFLAYRRRLEARPNENAGEGEVEYWIRRRLVLEAIAGDRGINGVDLLWRRRW